MYDYFTIATRTFNGTDAKGNPQFTTTQRSFKAKFESLPTPTVLNGAKLRDVQSFRITTQSGNATGVDIGDVVTSSSTNDKFQVVDMVTNNKETIIIVSYNN